MMVAVVLQWHSTFSDRSKDFLSASAVPIAAIEVIMLLVSGEPRGELSVILIGPYTLFFSFFRWRRKEDVRSIMACTQRFITQGRCNGTRK